MIAHKIRKRSLIGSRVAVPTGNGFYIPATVQAVCCNDDGKECITAKADNNQTSEYLIPDVIGQGHGLKNITNAKLQKFQKVYFKMNEVENMGYVISTIGDDAIVSFSDIKQGKIRLPITELQLIEHGNQQKNDEIKKTAISGSHQIIQKRRNVSESIEVPKISRARKSSEEPTMDELMAAMVLTNMSSSPIFHNPKSPLIKRDVSPHSYDSSGVGSWNQDVHMSPTKDEIELPSKNDLQLRSPDPNNNPASPEDPIESDSEINDNVQPNPTFEDREAPSNIVRNNTPHPIKRENLVSMSPNRPTVLVSPRSQPYPVKSSKLSRVTEENSSTVDMQQMPLAPVYYIPNIYSHQYQQMNFGGIGTPPNVRAVTLEDRPYRDLSPLVTGQPLPDEQNIPSYIGSAPPSFYFPLMHTNTSLPSSPNSFSSSTNFSRHTSSPLATRPEASAPSGPRATQPVPIAVNGRYAVLQDHCYQTGPAQPINIPTAKAFSWHSTPHIAQSFSPKPSIIQQRQHMHQAASPKMPSKQTLPPGRSKVRGDGKKCRKVYGMENRDMWCTACRWKKACQRFPD